MFLGKNLFEDNFHDWKIIPLFLIGEHLGKNFKFHSNIDLRNDIFSKFPSFYQDTFIKWINNYTEKSTLRSMICLNLFGLTQILRLTVSLCIFLFF